MKEARIVAEGHGAPDIRRRLADALGCGVVLGLLWASARAGGGSFPDQYLGMGIAALVGAALLLLLRPVVPRPARRAFVAVGGLGLYAGWLGLSGSWSVAPGGAAAGFQRHLAYLALLVLGLVVVGSGRGARGLVVTVWVGLVGIALAGLTSRLLPGLDLAPLRDPAFQDYRLSWPITYWNAQGTVCVMAIVLGLGFVADRRSPPVLRAVAAGVVPLVAVGQLLTVSRGSIVALAVGVVALVALSRRPLQAAAVALACAGPAAVGVLLATGQPAIVDDPTALPSLADSGPRLVVELLALGVLAAGLAAAALWGLRQVEGARRPRPWASGAPRWTPVVVLGLGVVVLVTLLATAGRVDGPIAGRTAGVRSFVDTQRSDFLDPQAQTRTGLDRLGTVGGSRSDLFRVALDQFGDAPIIGEGGGSYPSRWLRERRTSQPVQNAHSLPLEVLAETGVVGFALLGATFAAIGWGAIRARRAPGVMSRSTAAGVSAALATFGASCAVDWTWQMATVTAAALVLAATLLVEGRRPGAPDRGPRRRRLRLVRRTAGRGSR